MKAAFTVTVDYAETAMSREDIAGYVADAVLTMSGCLHPADPRTSIFGVRVRDHATGEVVGEQRDWIRYDPEFDHDC